MAGTGLALTSSHEGDGGGATMGGWAALLRSVAPGWSVGAEAGYFALPGIDYNVLNVVGFPLVSSDFRVMSASAVVRWRNEIEMPVHLIGSLGYYNEEQRDHRASGSDPVERNGHVGFGLGAGISGSGSLRPGFQVRWHHVDRTKAREQLHGDTVSFEVGLYFN
jgi:hypothetical protein